MIRHEAVAWSNEKDCSGKIVGGGDKEFFTIWGMKQAIPRGNIRSILIETV